MIGKKKETFFVGTCIHMYNKVRCVRSFDSFATISVNKVSVILSHARLGVHKHAEGERCR